jgi:hypothetical protein
MTNLGCAYIRFTWNKQGEEKVVNLDIIKPHQINEIENGFEYILEYSKEEDLLEIHEVGQVTFALQNKKTKKKHYLSDDELVNISLRLGNIIENYVTNLEFPTVIKLSNFKRHPQTTEPIGDLWMCEQLVDELYKSLGKETRQFDVCQDKVVYNELMFSKSSSGGMTMNTDNDVYLGGEFGDTQDPIQQIPMDAKVGEFNEKYLNALERLLNACGYNASSFDIGVQNSNASGEALSIREGRSISTIEEKKRQWEIYLEVICTIILKIKGKDAKFDIAFVEQGIDPVEAKNTLFALYDRGAISGDDLKDGLIKLGLV